MCRTTIYYSCALNLCDRPWLPGVLRVRSMQYTSCVEFTIPLHVIGNAFCILALQAASEREPRAFE
jgi:hypothetical protein